jgi:hypothetical protein
MSLIHDLLLIMKNKYSFSFNNLDQFKENLKLIGNPSQV